MSIHSDAADAAVADQAGALSAPARLGLLRFERLNEASWAMLYLDPRCETSLGLPAQALCSLIDAPYASLMEPSVRHRLHEDIQLQLAEHGSYQVSYLFHSPDAPYHVIEVGESLQRHGRPLLRGYLLRVMGNEALTGEWEAHTLALRSTLALLQEIPGLGQTAVGAGAGAADAAAGAVPLCGAQAPLGQRACETPA
ncbi:hypothetical protein Q3H58_004143 [Pseudomonas psychrotolerans]|nr:hypothetical protein [Pseudomonas psychrotolerans]